MQRSNKTLRILRDQKGMMSMDFIFAMILGMGFTVVFFSLTLTLSLVEVTQYFTFSIARSSLGAHETRSLQIALGNAKYRELRERPVFKALFGKGWFQLPAQPSYGSDPLGRGFNDEYAADPNDDNETFIGARLRVQANVLRRSGGMLGATSTNNETGVANVQTFLGREVTTTECRENFNRARWNNIKNLGGGTYSAVGNVGGNPALITDNGC